MNSEPYEPAPSQRRSAGDVPFAAGRPAVRPAAGGTPGSQALSPMETEMAGLAMFPHPSGCLGVAPGLPRLGGQCGLSTKSLDLGVHALQEEFPHFAGWPHGRNVQSPQTPRNHKSGGFSGPPLPRRQLLRGNPKVDQLVHDSVKARSGVALHQGPLGHHPRCSGPSILGSCSTGSGKEFK